MTRKYCVNKTVYNYEIIILTTDEEDKKMENLPEIRVSVNTEEYYTNWIPEHEKEEPGTIFETLEAAQKGIQIIKVKDFAKSHTVISGMANSLLINTFYEYADTSDANKQIYKLVSRELLKCENAYLRMQTFTVSEDILNKAVVLFNLMDAEDKKNVKDTLEIYSWLEKDAPFVSIYNKIK